MKKKVLFAYTDMIIGGSTTSLLSLLQELDKSKYDIDLILYKNEGPMLDSIPEGINLLQPACKYPTKSSLLWRLLLLIINGYFFKALYASLKYRKKISLHGQVMMEARAKIYSRKLPTNYDIAVGYLEGWPNRYIASNKIAAAKKIGWLHIDYLKSYYDPSLDKEHLSKLDAVVSVSQECEVRNSSIFNFKSSLYLPNILSGQFIKNRAILEQEEDKDYCDWKNYSGTKIISVGRINNTYKGYDRIIPAAKTLRDKSIDFRWIVIGDGIDMALMQETVTKEKLECFVSFIGARTNALPYIKSSDLLILPSRYEGKPMVITESQIIGTVPVVTEYSSAKEQIINGETGLILPNTDTALSDSICAIIKDTNSLDSIRTNLQKTSFGNTHDIAKYDDLFCAN